MNFQNPFSFQQRHREQPLPPQVHDLSSPPYSPVRRKPLPQSATPIVSSGTLTPELSPKRPASTQVPTFDRPLFPSRPESHSPTPSPSEDIIFRDLDRFPHGDSPNLNQRPWIARGSALNVRVQLPTPRLYPTSPLSSSHARFFSEPPLNQSQSRNPLNLTISQRRASASTMAVSSLAPGLNIPLDIPDRKHSPSNSEVTEETNKPRSPSNRLTSFFRWGSASEQGGMSPSTSVSDRHSPALSPKSSYPSNRSLPSAIDIPRANASGDIMHSDSGVSFPPYPSEIEAIEEEVRIVSADLAASIRREMDLEDLVERLQDEAAQRTNGGAKRTSDYFSDAGTPARYLDPETNQEYYPEKLQRKADQEKAQVRLEMVAKVQDERQRRKLVELHVKELEDRLSRNDNPQLTPSDPSGRIRELEVSLDDARRRLSEERTMKENYEDLLSALKGELEDHRSERDNLRDEVVPQLRARVEGLESEALELQKITYDHSRMQQELLNLRNENAILSSAARTQSRQSRPPTRPASQPMSPPSLNISIPLNPKDRESLAEKVKDVEAQRDALHAALKSLRERQQYENKRSRQRIKALEEERDQALRQSPRRWGHDREVTTLRNEIERLRQRANEAMDQKFVCERGLGTLKMDLEKAEQETCILRALLQEHDDLVSQHTLLRDSHVRLSMKVSELKQGLVNEPISLSLQQAYRDLQTLHERSLLRLDELETKGTDLSGDLDDREKRLSQAHEASQRVIQKLQQSVAQAESERDTAQVEADTYRQRAESLQQSEKQHLTEERILATQLKISSERVEELAAQVRVQLESNNALRDRLADAISRGEVEQKQSAERINELQGRLKRLEDKVLEAQQQTDDAVARHEEELRQMKETQTTHLRRLKSVTFRSRSQFGPKSPLSPFLRSPKLEWTTQTGARITVPDSSRVEFLEKRVEELEDALAQADNEMEEVVEKMSLAQIEVLDLQSERDEAARRTRKLQAEIAAEKANYINLA